MGEMKEARKGKITKLMKNVARKEGVSPGYIRRKVASGRIVIMEKDGSGLGIGEGLRTKINTNIGTSPDHDRPYEERKKLEVAVEAGTDTVMDLSIGKGILRMLEMTIRNSSVPVGSVPIYTTFIESLRKGESIMDISEDDFLAAIEEHVKRGVNFVTIHAAITKKAYGATSRRTIRIVSRGGAFVAAWMKETGRENPLYTRFDDVLDMLKERDVVLSIGDALRPGCVEDGGDAAQNMELIIQGKLVERARKAGVQTICEGPGHMKISDIGKNIRFQKRVCRGAPYYVLGPIVTDIAVGYDHISSAIGGAIAAISGADFLCVVTPSEHVALPSINDIREGVLASKIAAHAADMVKKGDLRKDREMGIARAKLDWKKQFSLAIESSKAKEYRRRRGSGSGACSMCGKYCAIKIVNE